MLFQNEKYSCGVFSLANAITAMGHRAPVAKIAQIAGLSKAGVSHHGLLQAIEILGFRCRELREMEYASAEEKLLSHLRGFPAILCVEKDEHWVTAIGTNGRRVIVFDSDDCKANRKVSGVHILNPRQLRRYWTAGPENFRYALLILPPEKGTKK